MLVNYRISRMCPVWIAGALLAAITAPAFVGNSVTVGQRDKKFSEATVNIRPGDKVVFVNLDEVTHNVYSTSPGNEFDLKVQRPGRSTGVTFSAEGVADVRCAIHPKMKLTVVVKR